ncbi:MAG: hypothetical protein EZS26_002498 [Candidatus Ordinivivax streblomastigis]|uniref:Uncharacterized protein n=1 Tax=Candidatus Ordinivivax streblomastigis TaxID=2540710 RepID=A0A5M8NW48_9BACT|nr:MAG: hypothetical protein EZS26_002498 [Candidatus Ordinivivax streblomastigis]
MKNSRNIVKQKLLPLLSNLHIITLRWAKRLLITCIAITLMSTVFHWSAGICLAIIVGFLLIRSLIRLVFRMIITLIYILLILLIVSLILL